MFDETKTVLLIKFRNRAVEVIFIYVKLLSVTF